VSAEFPLLAPELEVLVPPDASELPPCPFAVPPVVAPPEPPPDCPPDPLWVAPCPDGSDDPACPPAWPAWPPGPLPPPALLGLALVFPLQPSVNAPASKTTAKSLFMSNSFSLSDAVVCSIRVARDECGASWRESGFLTSATPVRNGDAGGRDWVIHGGTILISDCTQSAATLDAGRARRPQRQEILRPADGLTHATEQLLQVSMALHKINVVGVHHQQV
jgi:hypothetical protein